MHRLYLKPYPEEHASDGEKLVSLAKQLGSLTPSDEKWPKTKKQLDDLITQLDKSINIKGSFDSTPIRLLAAESKKDSYELVIDYLLQNHGASKAEAAIGYSYAGNEERVNELRKEGMTDANLLDVLIGYIQHGHFEKAEKLLSELKDTEKLSKKMAILIGYILGGHVKKYDQHLAKFSSEEIQEALPYIILYFARSANYNKVNELLDTYKENQLLPIALTGYVFSHDEKKIDATLAHFDKEFADDRIAYLNAVFPALNIAAFCNPKVYISLSRTIFSHGILLDNRFKAKLLFSLALGGHVPFVTKDSNELLIQQEPPLNTMIVWFTIIPVMLGIITGYILNGSYNKAAQYIATVNEKRDLIDSKSLPPSCFLKNALHYGDLKKYFSNPRRVLHSLTFINDSSLRQKFAKELQDEKIILLNVPILLKQVKIIKFYMKKYSLGFDQAYACTQSSVGMYKLCIWLFQTKSLPTHILHYIASFFIPYLNERHSQVLYDHFPVPLSSYKMGFYTGQPKIPIKVSDKEIILLKTLLRQAESNNKKISIDISFFLEKEQLPIVNMFKRFLAIEFPGEKITVDKAIETGKLIILDIDLETLKEKWTPRSVKLASH